MEKATIKDFGKVDFDPIDLDSNVYDLYTVVVFDPETNETVKRENYTSDEEYNDALVNTWGREVMEEQEEPGWCTVLSYFGDRECECTYHTAYVIDHEDED